MYASWYRAVDRKFANIISRGSLTKPIDDSEDVQNADVTTFPGQDFAGVLRAQNYGFTSRPGSGAEIVMVCEDGMREGAILLSADHPLLRPKIAEYESCLWTKFGTHVWLKADSSLDVKAAKFKMTLETDAVIETPKFAVKSEEDELVKAIFDALTAVKTVSDTLAGGSGPLPAPAMAAFSNALTPVLQRISQFLVS